MFIKKKIKNINFNNVYIILDIYEIKLTYIIISNEYKILISEV